MFISAKKNLDRSKGFSLIELMVVMAIMAVLMSLSGALMQKNINQQTKQVELEQVKQLFKKLSYQAYYGGGRIQVRLEKNQMKIVHVINSAELNNEIKFANREQNERYIDNAAHNIQYVDFEQLVFVAQDYSISSKGIISPDHYQILGQQEIKTFKLMSLFNEQIL